MAESRIDNNLSGRPLDPSLTGANGAPATSDSGGVNEARQGATAQSCFVEGGFPNAPEMPRGGYVTRIWRQDANFRSRLENLRSSESAAFQKFLLEFRPFLDALDATRPSLFGFSERGLDPRQLEELIQYLEEFERFCKVGELLRREFPQGLENDPTWRAIRDEDEARAASILQSFSDITRGGIVLPRPGREMATASPQDIEDLHQIFINLRESGLDKFLARAGSEQGISLRFEDFGFKFKVRDSCDERERAKAAAARAPKKPETTEAELFELASAANEEMLDRLAASGAGEAAKKVASSRDDLLASAARLQNISQIARSFRDNPDRIRMSREQLAELRLELEKEMAVISGEAEKIGGADGQASREIAAKMREMARLLDEGMDDAGEVCKDEGAGAALGDETILLLSKVTEKLARCEAFIYSRRLENEKASLGEMGMEPAVLQRINRRISEALNAGLDLDSGRAIGLGRQVLTEIDRNALRLAVQQEIEIFSDPAGILGKGYREWRIACGGGGMHPKYYKAAVAELKEIQSLLAKGRHEEATQRYSEFASSRIHRELVQYLEAYRGLDLMAKLAIVSAAAFTSGLTATALAPYCEGSALGSIALMFAEGAFFIGSEKLISAAVTGENPFEGRTFEEKLKNLGTDILFMGPMLRYLKKVGKISDDAARAIFGATSEAAAKRAIAKFAAEFLAFTAWETAEGNARLALEGQFDPAAISEEVYSLEGSENRLVFLLGLKLGHAVMNPVTGPIGRSVQTAIARKHSERYKAIQSEAGRVIDEMGKIDQEVKGEAAQRRALDSAYARLESLHRKKLGILRTMRGAMPEGEQRTRLDEAITAEEAAQREVKGARRELGFNESGMVDMPFWGRTAASGVGTVSPAASEAPALQKDGGHAGLFYGGGKIAGWAILVPKSGEIVSRDGIQIKFDCDTGKFVFRGDDSSEWKVLEPGSVIKSAKGAHFIFIELREPPADIADRGARMDDLNDQIRGQISTVGIDRHMETLGGRRDEIDRENLGALFTESFEKAEFSFAGRPERSAGGILGGVSEVFAIVDPQTGRIYRFCDDGPVLEISRGDRPRDRFWFVERNDADGKFYWGEKYEREHGAQNGRPLQRFIRPVDMEGIPADATVVGLTLERMTGRIRVDQEAIGDAGLSPTGRERIENLDGFVAAIGGATSMKVVRLAAKNGSIAGAAASAMPQETTPDNEPPPSPIIERPNVPARREERARDTEPLRRTLRLWPPPSPAGPIGADGSFGGELPAMRPVDSDDAMSDRAREREARLRENFTPRSAARVVEDARGSSFNPMDADDVRLAISLEEDLVEDLAGRLDKHKDRFSDIARQELRKRLDVARDRLAALSEKLEGREPARGEFERELLGMDRALVEAFRKHSAEIADPEIRRLFEHEGIVERTDESLDAYRKYRELVEAEEGAGDLPAPAAVETPAADVKPVRSRATAEDIAAARGWVADFRTDTDEAVDFGRMNGNGRAEGEFDLYDDSTGAAVEIKFANSPLGTDQQAKYLAGLRSGHVKFKSDSRDHEFRELKVVFINRNSSAESSVAADARAWALRANGELERPAVRVIEISANDLIAAIAPRR